MFALWRRPLDSSRTSSVRLPARSFKYSRRQRKEPTVVGRLDRGHRAMTWRCVITTIAWQRKLVLMIWMIGRGTRTHCYRLSCRSTRPCNPTAWTSMQRLTTSKRLQRNSFRVGGTISRTAMWEVNNRRMFMLHDSRCKENITTSSPLPHTHFKRRHCCRTPCKARQALARVWRLAAFAPSKDDGGTFARLH